MLLISCRHATTGPPAVVSCQHVHPPPDIRCCHRPSPRSRSPCVMQPTSTRQDTVEGGHH
eukprot:1073768-Alexandrium_andersonii.AAC.1